MEHSGVPTIFADERRRLRRQRAAARQRRGGAATWLADAMIEDVIERLGFLRFEGRSALVAGLGAGGLANRLAKTTQVVTEREGIAFAQPFATGPFDLIISLNELDTVNDLPGALIRLRRSLAPAGLLLAAMTGADSLPALRRIMLAADGERAAARVHPQIDNRAASALLQRAGFARQVVDRYPLTLRYGGLARLVADLRDQALTSILADRAPPLGKAALARAEAAFATLAEKDGKVSERFEILTLTAWNG